MCRCQISARLLAALLLFFGLAERTAVRAEPPASEKEAPAAGRLKLTEIEPKMVILGSSKIHSTSSSQLPKLLPAPLSKKTTVPVPKESKPAVGEVTSQATVPVRPVTAERTAKKTVVAPDPKLVRVPDTSLEPVASHENPPSGNWLSNFSMQLLSGLAALLVGGILLLGVGLLWLRKYGTMFQVQVIQGPAQFPHARALVAAAEKASASPTNTDLSGEEILKRKEEFGRQKELAFLKHVFEQNVQLREQMGLAQSSMA
jgi:hypothetical protein